MTARVTGAGDDITVTWGGCPERPGDDDQARVLVATEQQFAKIFGHTHEASAVTVGPHVPEGDDDDDVG